MTCAMKSSVLLLAAPGAVTGSLRAEAVDIHWSGAGRFVHSGQTAAGKFVAVCGKLPSGFRIQCEFENCRMRSRCSVERAASNTTHD